MKGLQFTCAGCCEGPSIKWPWHQAARANLNTHPNTTHKTFGFRVLLPLPTCPGSWRRSALCRSPPSLFHNFDAPDLQTACVSRNGGFACSHAFPILHPPNDGSHLIKNVGKFQVSGRRFHIRCFLKAQEYETGYVA